MGTGTSQGIPEIGCKCPVCLSTDPRDNRLRCSVHLACGNTSLIVDTGPDFRQQALRAGIPSIDGVLYTHTHADHLMGVDDLRQYNRRQGNSIPIYLPRSFEDDFMGAFGYTVKDTPEELYRPKLDLNLLSPGDRVDFAELSAQFVPVMHGADEIAAFLFGIGNRRAAYVSECKSLSQDSLETLKGLDLLILGAIWKIDKSHPNHLTLCEALDLIEQLAPKTTYLTHVTHLMGPHKEVEAELPDTIHMAYDGLKLSI